MKNLIAFCYASKNENLIIIPCCPFCGEKHIHGISEIEIIDGKQTYGYRTPHCSEVENKPDGYLLVKVSKCDAIYKSRVND